MIIMVIKTIISDSCLAESEGCSRCGAGELNGGPSAPFGDGAPDALACVEDPMVSSFATWDLTGWCCAVLAAGLWCVDEGRNDTPVCRTAAAGARARSGAANLFAQLAFCVVFADECLHRSGGSAR